MSKRNRRKPRRKNEYKDEDEVRRSNKDYKRQKQRLKEDRYG
jgi:hypothetical protein